MGKSGLDIKFGYHCTDIDNRKSEATRETVEAEKKGSLGLLTFRSGGEEDPAEEPEKAET